MLSKVDLLLSQLQKVQQRGKGQWLACCPAHEDRSPSLAIKENHDGRILVKCFAGCGATDVVHAVGLTLADLFPEGGEESFNPFAFARAEKKREAEAKAQESHEKLIIEMANAKRERGEKLSQKDLDRELEAYKRLRGANEVV
jgi:DNA primase